MNTVPDVLPLDYATVEAEVTARDREVANRFTKDTQITSIRVARNYLGDRVSRVVAPHRLTDPKAGPLIAVKLHILTRKSLGGLETDLDSRVLKSDGERVRRSLCRGRGRRFRRRRCARLPLAGGHVPWRLRILRPGCGPGRGARHLAPRAHQNSVPFSGSSTWKSVSVISDSLP